jgi:hypothetical protein
VPHCGSPAPVFGVCKKIVRNLGGLYSLGQGNMTVKVKDANRVIDW